MRTTILGMISIILGILAMIMPGMTGLSVLMVLGVLVLIGGIVRIIWAFQAESLGKGILRFAIGGLTIICGIILIGNPIFTSGLVTILLALYFILDGISEIVAGFRNGPGTGGIWLLFGGVISILLGLVLWAQYPLSGAWALGILLGIKLFMAGLIMVAAGSVVRSIAKE